MESLAFLGFFVVKQLYNENRQKIMYIYIVIKHGFASQVVYRHIHDIIIANLQFAHCNCYSRLLEDITNLFLLRTQACVVQNCSFHAGTENMELIVSSHC